MSTWPNRCFAVCGSVEPVQTEYATHFSHTVPVTSLRRCAERSFTNGVEFQASMNDCRFKLPIVQCAVASKQHAERLPSAVTCPSVNADQQGNGSRSAPMRPWFPAVGR